MDLNSILTMVIVGGVAGWLAGMIFSGKGLGMIINIVVGIVGAFFGTQLFKILKISIASGLVGSIIVATIGALVLLVLLRFIKKAV